MARLHGSKNRKTLLREAEEGLGKARSGEAMVDPLHVMEKIMMHYYTQALSFKAMEKPDTEIDAAMALALHAAEKCAPYRHARLAAIKLAGDPNDPLRMLDTATADELKAEIMKHLKILAPVLELDAVPELRGWRRPTGVPMCRGVQRASSHII